MPKGLNPSESQKPAHNSMPRGIDRQPLRLRLYPDAVLRETAAPVEAFGARLVDLVGDMLDLMRLRGGIGLAAPQVGLCLRLFVADVGDGPLALVNPAISPASSDTDRMFEGCLSLPDVTVEIDRKSSVVVRGFDPNGRPLHLDAWGLMARVVQHETDHLDGILICDYTPDGTILSPHFVRMKDHE